MAVQTVLGKIKGSELGVTLTHEHVHVDFRQFYKAPPGGLESAFSGITLSNLGYIRQYPYSSQENLQFFGPEVESSLLNDIERYKAAGGGTIVENSCWGLQRNLPLMLRVAKQTGIHVIAGTGHYVEECQPAGTKSLNVEQLSDLYREELTVGCLEERTVLAGFIGEVGSSWPVTDFEKRCIEATALVQSELGCPVSFHPGRNELAPPEIVRRYAEAGGQVGRAVMSHLDRTMRSVESLLEFSKFGTFLQFDLFGNETSYYQLSPDSEMPSDSQRIDRIKGLLSSDPQLASRILLSHDIHTRHRLTDYGGHGYAHIPRQVRLHMKTKGLSEENIEKMMVKNPAAWLAGA